MARRVAQQHERAIGREEREKKEGNPRGSLAHNPITTMNERDDPAVVLSQEQVEDDGRNGRNCDDDGGPLPTLQEVLACQINEWYPALAKEEEEEEEEESGAAGGVDPQRRRLKRRRQKITIPTVLVPLPDDFVAFLRQEQRDGDGRSSEQKAAVGLRLPRGAQTSSTLWMSGDNDDGGSDHWSSSDSEHGDHDNNSRHATTALQHLERNGHDPAGPDHDDGNDCAFPALDRHIENAIHKLGGTVTPKLNWSAPKDATWLPLNGTLACRTPGDVYLLLQSSDFVAYDLDHALIDVQPLSPSPPRPPSPTPPPSLPVPTLPHVPHTYCLALRKWCNLHPSREFRCFVRDHQLVAVSQRHHSQHYPHLANDRLRLRKLLRHYFRYYVQRRYAHGQVSRYVFDTYIDKRHRVWLLDFNVWGRRTDPLLFTWNELEQLESFSHVEEQEEDEEVDENDGDDATDDDTDSEEEGDDDVTKARGGFELRVVETAHEIRGDPLASYRAPIDAVHVASWTGAGNNGSGGGTGTGGSAFEAFRQLCVAPSELDGEEDTDGET